MSLILAIEPDHRQAAQLADLIRGRLNADLLHAQTTEGALTALAGIGDRVPDLVLVPSLLSAQEDAAIAGALRVIAAAANVRMLTIPRLADPEQPPQQRGVFAKLRGRKPRTIPGGCDPAVFADQIASYLAEAAAERRAAQEAAADLAALPQAEVAAPVTAARPSPAAEPVLAPPTIPTPIRYAPLVITPAPPPPVDDRLSVILDEPVEIVDTPLVFDAPAAPRPDEAGQPVEPSIWLTTPSEPIPDPALNTRREPVADISFVREETPWRNEAPADVAAVAARDTSAVEAALRLAETLPLDAPLPREDVVPAEGLLNEAEDEAELVAAMAETQDDNDSTSLAPEHLELLPSAVAIEPSPLATTEEWLPPAAVEETLPTAFEIETAARVVAPAEELASTAAIDDESQILALEEVLEALALEEAPRHVPVAAAPPIPAHAEAPPALTAEEAPPAVAIDERPMAADHAPVVVEIPEGPVTHEVVAEPEPVRERVPVVSRRKRKAARKAAAESDDRYDIDALLAPLLSEIAAKRTAPARTEPSSVGPSATEATPPAAATPAHEVMAPAVSTVEPPEREVIPEAPQPAAVLPTTAAYPPVEHIAVASVPATVDVAPAIHEQMLVEQMAVEQTRLEPTPVDQTPLEPVPVPPTLLEATPVDPPPVESTAVEPTPVAPTRVEQPPMAAAAAAETDIDPMFFADDVHDGTADPAPHDRPAWVELIESLRKDIERLKAERIPPAEATPAPSVIAQVETPPAPRIGRVLSIAAARPASPPPPTAVAKPRTLPPRPKAPRPIQDQWGLFDPEQCGFAALRAKLDEISAREDVSV